MEDDFSEWIDDKINKADLNPTIMKMATLQTKISIPILDFYNEAKKVLPSQLVERMLIVQIKGIIMVHSDNFDCALNILNEIKKSIIRTEKDFNVEQKDDKLL